MALIRSLEPGKGTGRSPQSEVDATFTVVDDPVRGKIVKITTYGSDVRKSEPKPSQVIELDAVMARKLISILEEQLGI
ncbi:hypothetical protein [Gordonia polyisoprenivorans]|uniref:hypothetical protein n=1 Tax=Gordonia polyisoprenivorans TaxID=84595 RepID=UPI0030D51C94